MPPPIVTLGAFMDVRAVGVGAADDPGTGARRGLVSAVLAPVTGVVGSVRGPALKVTRRCRHLRRGCDQLFEFPRVAAVLDPLVTGWCRYVRIGWQVRFGDLVDNDERCWALVDDDEILRDGRMRCED